MKTKITKLSQISNIIFFVFAIYFLNFLWIEYWLHSIKKAFWLAFPAAIIVSAIVYGVKNILGSKQKRQALIAKEKERLEIQLVWGEQTSINSYLLTLFDLKPTKEITPNHYALNDESEIRFCFDPSGLNASMLSKIVRTSHATKMIIFCIGHTPFLKITNKEIRIITLEDIYNRQKQLGSKIQSEINLENKTKYSLKSILCIVLNKQQSTKYFWSSILLIAMSLFTPYNVYYLVTSTLLLLLSLYSRFNSRFNV